MNTVQNNILNSYNRTAFRLVGAGLLITMLLMTGCASVRHIPTSAKDIGPSYKPSNVYVRSAAIPSEMRRVVVMPVTSTSSDAFMDAGVDALETTLQAELIKTKRFEVIPLTRERLMALTGRPGWRIDEVLPDGIFKKIQKATGCDAVLFAQLTRYQPYQPIAIGWKFTLVQTATVVIDDLVSGRDASNTISHLRSQTFWSADEVLDSGDPSVSRAARAYYADHLSNEAPAADVSTMASSPQRFGQYAIYSLLGTLPPRAKY
jgi:hypothetical protein